MKSPKGIPHHRCCPAEWRGTPALTGSFELDRVIAANPNKDLPDRLRAALTGGTDAYGARTGYSGYSGYSGDD